MDIENIFDAIRLDALCDMIGKSLGDSIFAFKPHGASPS